MTAQLDGRNRLGVPQEVLLRSLMCADTELYSYSITALLLLLMTNAL